MFPLVGNDGVVYIDHSNNLIDRGLVVYGYRQFGYPAALWVVRAFSGVVGAEPLLAMTVVQRGLLIVAGLLAVRLWGWWATPLLLFLIAPGTIAYTNLILTEGLALPLALILVFPFVRLLAILRSDPDGKRHREALVLGALIVALATALLSIRFTYAVFGLAPLVIMLASWRTSFLRWSAALFAGFIVLATTIVIGASVENHRELGVFYPSADGGFTSYYYAWNTVFSDPDNREDPDLARFYNEGVVYAFEHELAARGLSHSARKEEFDREIHAMLEAADMTVMSSRVQAMTAGLVGGRKHDIQVAVDGIVSSTRHDIDDWMYLNRFARERGIEAFALEYNGGQVPAAVITNAIGKRLWFLDARRIIAVIMPLGLVTLMFGLRYPSTRFVGLAGLGVVFGSVVGHGLIWADNFRFLTVGGVFGVAAAIAVAHAIWSQESQRDHASLSRRVSTEP